MTADYLDNGSTRKKYLAPLVVIMLCAVALTGAAYAYSTTVTGNGDIKGDYTIIDIYDTQKYEATSNFDVSKNTLTFYTETDKTGGTLKYRAYLDTNGGDYVQLVYKAYLKINTTNPESQTQQFEIGTCSFTYNAPDNCGKILINDDEKSGDLPGDAVKVYASADKDGDPLEKLTENTLYYVEITLNVTCGYTDAQTEAKYFCEEESFDEVQKKINSFSSSTKELAITISASPCSTSGDSSDSNQEGQ